MENTKKDRATLKSYFRNNAVPTEDNFQELIDAGLNQKDDGIVKIPDGPIAVQSSGLTEELIHFYKNFADAQPSWKINQKSGNRSGFSINDGAGTSRLFLDGADGSVGISTNAPAAKVDLNILDASGLLIRSGNSTGAANSQLTFGYNNTAQYRHAIRTRHDGGTTGGNAIDFYVWKQGTDNVNTAGTQHAMTLDGNGNVGIGITTPTAKLQIAASGSGNPASNGLYVYNSANAANQDAIINARVSGSNAGNPMLSLDVQGTSGWSIGIDNRQDQALKFSNAWDSLTTATKMTLQKNGNLGLGTILPAVRLDVTGQVKINDGSQGVGKLLTSDANGLASWVAPRKDFRPYGTASYLWDGTYPMAVDGTDPQSALASRGGASIGKYNNFIEWGNKKMFGLGSLSQEQQGTNTAPVNGVYLTLKATPGVHNALLLSTIDFDRWSIFAVWLCDVNGGNPVKLMRSSNNAYTAGDFASSYVIGPRNGAKETAEHAWMTFPVTADQVAAYAFNGNLKFILTSGPYNQETSLLYLSGFALVPNIYGYVQHPGLSLHFGLNGNNRDEMTWNSIWNNDALIMVPSRTVNSTFVKVVDPNKDLLITFMEHNAEWSGGTLQVWVGGDPNIFSPSAAFQGIASALYRGKAFIRPQGILIPKEIVSRQLITSPSAVPSMLRLQLKNPGLKPFHMRGIDTEIF